MIVVKYLLVNWVIGGFKQLLSLYWAILNLKKLFLGIINPLVIKVSLLCNKLARLSLKGLENKAGAFLSHPLFCKRHGVLQVLWS
jgi:hypothetical protein